MPNLVEIGQVVLEKKIFKICQYIFAIISPWKRAGALHLKKFEFPSPKDALCQVWLKQVQWFWKRRFLIFVNVFLLFRNYLPLEKGVALHLIKFESPSPKDALCQVWLKLAQWFLRRSRKQEKFTDRRTEKQTTDNSSGELNKRPTGLNGPLSIRDFTPTSCQKGSYL